MSNELTVVLPQKFKHLRELAKAINDRQEEIEAEKAQLVSKANSLGCNMRLQGLDLLRAKEGIEHGLWQDWLAAHCPSISYREASLFMRLAKVTHAEDLNDCHTWRDCEALLKTDLPQVEAQPKPWPVVPNLRTLQLCERWTLTIQKVPLENCPTSILTRYREILEPIVRQLWPGGFQ